MKLATVTLTSMAALMMGASMASADMILRQDASGNKIVVNTETETEARIYEVGGDNARPADCEGGAFYTTIDNDREVYTACEDDTMRFAVRMDDGAAVSGGASTSGSASASAAATADQPLEPYAPDTLGSKN